MELLQNSQELQDFVIFTVA